MVNDRITLGQAGNGSVFKITELCGAKRVGYFGPTQFYVALKLIAAAQSGLPVRTESIKCELPLPRFVMSKSDAEIRFGNPAELHGKKVQIPYLTTEKNSLKRMDDEDKQETPSPTMSPLASPPSSPPHYQRVSLSHGYSKLRSGTEQMQPVERELQDNSINYPDEPWRITEEQREYYVNQFRSLQPDPNSFISARKNGYPLPEGLPPTLQPEYLQAAFPKSKWECAIFDSYSESMPANQQPCDLNRMEKTSVKDMADFPVPTQDATTGDDKQASQMLRSGEMAPFYAADHISYSSTSIEETMKRGEDPPTPPPRPQKTHSRASSLDLNKVFQPSVPVSPSANFVPEDKVYLEASASKTKTEDMGKRLLTQDCYPHHRHFLQDLVKHKQSSKQKKAIQTAIRKNKEANAVLARLNSELQQQLKHYSSLILLKVREVGDGFLLSSSNTFEYQEMYSKSRAVVTVVVVTVAAVAAAAAAGPFGKQGGSGGCCCLFPSHRSFSILLPDLLISALKYLWPPDLWLGHVHACSSLVDWKTSGALH
ncbi:hypothetical protein U0070_022407 [Myodes glareolus]|uniref:Uncharacterized protein n=1 Tax=Myodes glareolus TaxID=447135 RepID=A0AAW0HRI3_MYOGA